MLLMQQQIPTLLNSVFAAGVDGVFSQGAKLNSIIAAFADKGGGFSQQMCEAIPWYTGPVVKETTTAAAPATTTAAATATVAPTAKATTTVPTTPRSTRATETAAVGETTTDPGLRLDLDDSAGRVSNQMPQGGGGQGEAEGGGGGGGGARANDTNATAIAPRNRPTKGKSAKLEDDAVWGVDARSNSAGTPAPSDQSDGDNGGGGGGGGELVVVIVLVVLLLLAIPAVVALVRTDDHHALPVHVNRDPALTPAPDRAPRRPVV